MFLIAKNKINVALSSNYQLWNQESRQQVYCEYPNPNSYKANNALLNHKVEKWLNPT
jgi:hypothetical protein